MLRVAVTGTGIPLICVHGWTMNASMWIYQNDLINAGVQLITYDRRAYGASTAGFDPTQEVADIEAIRNYLGLPKINVLGMSQGGRVSLRYGANFADKINSLILLSPSVDGFDGNPDTQDKIPLDAYQKMIAEGMIKTMRTDWLNHPLMMAECAKIQLHLKQMVEGYEGADLIKPDQQSNSLTTNLADIKCPCLVMVGGKEPHYIKNIANYLCQTLTAKHHVFAHENHLANMTAPEAFNKTVSDFLTSLTVAD
ncbi:MAG: alpha/beta fold hydrolase [Parvibaculales bacterium]